MDVQIRADYIFESQNTNSSMSNSPYIVEPPIIRINGSQNYVQGS